MVTVGIENPVLLQLLLSEMIGRIETPNGLDALLQQGCDASFIDLIRHSPARDLIDVSARIKGLEVTIPTLELHQQLQKLDRVRRDTELCEYFIVHGASRRMMSAIFKKSAEEVRLLRHTLLANATVGRAPMPKDHSIRDEIQRTWSDIRKQYGAESIRDRLYRLHQQFSIYSIDSLSSTLLEFGDDLELTGLLATNLAVIPKARKNGGAHSIVVTSKD